MLPVSPQLKLEYIIYNSARNTLYIIFGIITLPVIRTELNGSLEEVVFIPEITLSNINCLHVNHALSDENSVHMILCQGCDLLHLKVTRSDSGWRKDWMENLTNAPENCKYVEENFITEAVFMAAGRNKCSLLYLYGQPSRIVGLKYRVSLDRITSRLPTSYFSNSGLGICRGLYYFNTQHYYTVLIADESPYSGVPHSGRAIWSLSVDSNTTERLERFETYPRDFSSDPSNNTNVFVITSNNLKKLVFDGSRYSQAQFVDDEEGVKVLALTSTNFLIVPFITSKSGIVSVKLNPTRRENTLKQHKFTSLDFHRPSRTIFLSTETMIYYNVTRNTTQPTALPVSSTTTKLTTITHCTTILLHSTTKQGILGQAKKDTEPTSTWSYYITSQGTDTTTFYSSPVIVVIVVVSVIALGLLVMTMALRRRSLGGCITKMNNRAETPIALRHGRSEGVLGNYNDSTNGASEVLENSSDFDRRSNHPSTSASYEPVYPNSMPVTTETPIALRDGRSEGVLGNDNDSTNGAYEVPPHILENSSDFDRRSNQPSTSAIYEPVYPNSMPVTTGAQTDAGNQRFEDERTASEPLLSPMSPPEQASSHYQCVDPRLTPQLSLPPTDDTDQPRYILTEDRDYYPSSGPTGVMNNNGEQDDGENALLQNQLNENFDDAEQPLYETEALDNLQSDNLEHTSDLFNHTTVV